MIVSIKKNVLYKLNSTGDFFGEFSFFTGHASKFSIVSENFTNLIKVKRNDFLQVLHKFPKDYVKTISLIYH